jgi:hypothetical protein
MCRRRVRGDAVARSAGARGARSGFEHSTFADVKLQRINENRNGLPIWCATGSAL